MLTDANAAHYLALLYTHQRQFVANLLADIGDCLSLSVNLLCILLHGYLVAGGDSLHGCIEFLVWNAHSGTVGDIELQTFRNKSIQHLLQQNILRRWLGTRLLNLRIDSRDTLVEFRLQNHIIVDNGNHFVQ